MARYSCGSKDAAKIECINPRRNRWRVRWGFVFSDESASWVEADFDHKPTAGEIRTEVANFTNAIVDEKILSGYEWNGSPVWLSQVNQLNYKATFDRAVQTLGKNLPVTFKLGTDDKPVYYDFKTLDELQDFYYGSLEWIEKCIEEGWKVKDGINLTEYI